MKRRLALLLCALGLFLAGVGCCQAQTRAAPAIPADNAASIGFLTAGQLAQQCREGTAFSVTYCLAFLAGVHDSIRAYEQWLDQREFCAPGTVKQRDLSNAFLAFIATHPEYRDGLASSVAVVALKETWPCTTPGR